jgi:putative ABC transport system permease protein
VDPEPRIRGRGCVTANFFSVFGVPPMLGRTFRQEEEDAGRDRVVVLSHGLWTRRYRADRAP